MIRILRFILYIVLSNLFCFACSTKTTDEEREAPCGGKIIVPINLQSAPCFPFSVLSYSEKQLATMQHVTLFKTNPANESLEPYLCSSWDIDNTGRVYIIYLDSTAYFHDNTCFPASKGRNITAYDVEYSFYLLSTYSEGNKNFTNTVSRILGAKEFFKHSIHNVTDTMRIKGLQVINNYTLKITLESPSNLFLYNLSHPSAAIIPQEAYEKYGQTLSVGGGPFMYMPQKDTTQFLFVRNKSFFKFDALSNRLPYLDTVLFKKVNSSEQAVNLFLYNELDAVFYMNNELIERVVNNNSEGVPFRLVKSYSPTNKDLILFNVIHTKISDLYTNNSYVVDYQNVYLKSEL